MDITHTQDELKAIASKQFLQIELTKREKSIKDLFGVGNDEIRRITRIKR